MRIKLNFNVQKNFYLPVSHNEILQGFIYHNLDKVLADYLHDEGFNYQNRQFRLFTFSRILGGLSYDSYKKAFLISSNFSLIISSPKIEILENMANFIVKSHSLVLYGNEINLESIDVHMQKGKLPNTCKIRMLSPVTIYSTLTNTEGRNKTYYYNPMEEEFSELIKKNLEKKYELIYSQPPPEDDFQIKIIGSTKNKEKIIKYKDFIIKGWMGDFEIKANPELILTGYDAGLGGKNSQGFGCFEILKER